MSVWNRTEARAAALVADVLTLRVVPAPGRLRRGGGGDDAGRRRRDRRDDGWRGGRGGRAGARIDLVFEMGTVGVTWTDRLAALAAGRGIAFVDAPVSGSTGPAQAGELVVLASGPENTRSRVQPIFDAIGGHTSWLARAASGSRMKVALNNWLAASTEALAETLALSDALGLSPTRSSRSSRRPRWPRPTPSPRSTTAAGDFAPGFPLRHAFKEDTALALAAARERGLQLPLTQALESRWRGAIARGHGDEETGRDHHRGKRPQWRARRSPSPRGLPPALAGKRLGQHRRLDAERRRRLADDGADPVAPAGGAGAVGDHPADLPGRAARGEPADIVDRRRLLIAIEIWVVAVAAALAGLTAAGLVGPAVLLGFTFLIGMGLASYLPTWQSTVPSSCRPRSCRRRWLWAGSRSTRPARSDPPWAA